MTREEWIEKYKPDDVNNTYLDADFEKDNPRTAWTEYSADDGEFIRNGVGRVNAVGYYKCEIPYEEDEEIEIVLKTIEWWKDL